MGRLAQLHRYSVKTWRLRRLAAEIARLLPRDASVLDVGCGDGRLAAAVLHQRADLALRGLDVCPAPPTLVPVESYDGRRIPHGPASFDVVMLVDVLHHATRPMRLLGEAARVSRRWLLVKDHTLEGRLAGPTLRLMDAVGNAGQGITRPRGYWPEARWRGAFARLGLQIRTWNDRPGLYPLPASLVFDRRLHFLALLEHRAATGRRA